MISAARLEVLCAVAALVPPVGRPVLVAVDGPDGSGKTWFADELAQVLAPDRDVRRASVDDFHQPREHRHGAGRTGRTVWERSYDYRALRRELVDPWLVGAGATYRCRWHDLDSDALVDDDSVPVPATGVLVVDGVFAQRPELAAAWDLTVWLDVPPEVTVARMAARDGTPDDPDHPDQRRYIEAQAIYAEVCDPRGTADIVVDNRDPGAPRLRHPSVEGDHVDVRIPVHLVGDDDAVLSIVREAWTRRTQ